MEWYPSALPHRHGGLELVSMTAVAPVAYLSAGAILMVFLSNLDNHQLKLPSHPPRVSAGTADLPTTLSTSESGLAQDLHSCWTAVADVVHSDDTSPTDCMRDLCGPRI